MRKIYVVDTSVLLQDPESLWKFDDNELVIPAVVLEELDRQKRRNDTIGRHARQVAHHLDSLRDLGALHQGVPLPGGGTLRIELNHRAWDQIGHRFLDVNGDNRILAVAYNLQEEEKQNRSLATESRPVVLVSNDVLLRVKADVLGIDAEEYESGKALEASERPYGGFNEVTVDPDLIDRFYRDRFLPAEKLPGDWPPNHFVLLRAYASSKSALARFYEGENRFEPVFGSDAHPWGVTARNVQQRMALNLLLDDRLPLVTLTGPAGTGKTLLALAAGLQKVEEENLYRKLLISRPVVPLGHDIGYLPGDKDEKLRPWMQPIFDNLDYLSSDRRGRSLDDVLTGLQRLEIEALTYIRGRSIPNQFVVVDEAQNLTPHEAKTIISRAGEGSKFVLLGDPQQIDHPYLDDRNNGLTFAVERFKTTSVAGHVELVKGERSLLAETAVEVMEETPPRGTKWGAYERIKSTALG